MGDQDVRTETDQANMHTFMRALLDEARALEALLDTDLIETGVRRIGAEQEIFLVDRACRPASMSGPVLDQIDDPRFTHELAQFNLEANLSPQLLGGDCLRRMEDEANELLAVARRAAYAVGSQTVLTGILPTLKQSDLTLDNMVQVPRYRALNDTVIAMRGSDFRLGIKGIDQLDLKHDNLMLEACNTSFQVHFQVSPHEFANLYNIAQAVTGPVMAAAVNSPLLLGKRLWQETRIAVFEHSVDSRSDAHQARGHQPRVHFGNDWIESSVTEIFKEDIARFRIVLTNDVADEEDPFAMIERGVAPPLRALRLHNGTVYRWNRACYGVVDGLAHLRIENRVLPAGPTVLDEVSNAAFFFGLMSSMGQRDDVRDHISFDEVKRNFFAAARDGLKAQQTWLDGRVVPAGTLITDTLIPLAKEGLEASGISGKDIDRYIGTVADRVGAGRTGARWALESIAEMDQKVTLDERLRHLVAATIRNQNTDAPVAQWELADICGSQDWRDSYRTVGQFMTTDLFTVQPDDLVDFAASLMEWKHVRHVPVEDSDGLLVGLVTHRALLRMLARGRDSSGPVPVREIMRPDPVTVPSNFRTVEAIRLMREKKLSCLPVVDDGKLVGVLTERDLIGVAANVLEAQLDSDD